MNKLFHAVFACGLFLVTSCFAGVIPYDASPNFSKTVLSEGASISQANKPATVKTAFPAPTATPHVDPMISKPTFEAARAVAPAAKLASPAATTSDDLLVVLAGIGLIGVIAVRRMSL
jgi:hypothetical protein